MLNEKSRYGKKVKLATVQEKDNLDKLVWNKKIVQKEKWERK